jgi:hypothetical protein
VDKVVIVTFTMEPDDLNHPTGVTEDTYTSVCEAIYAIGGENVDFELSPDED